MKTPEEMAIEWLKEEYGDTSNWTYAAQEMSLDAFYAGYEAGRKITDQEIVDILVDIREREAKERSKRPVLQQERNDRIWEKIKIKLVGIF